MKLKVVIADDHSFFRNGVVMAVNRMKYAEVVGEASNGIELLELVNELKPHIVLTDIKMPLMDGIEATKSINELNIGTKVVAISMFGDEEHFKSMMEAGVDGFLLKNSDRDDLDKALQAVAQDQQYFSPEFMIFFRNKYLGKQKKNSDSGLTKRELDVLNLVVDGLSNQEIADKLFISLRTVTTHRANINMKTGSKNTAQLISYAVHNGLVEI